MGKIAFGLTLLAAGLQALFMGLEIFGWKLPVMRELSHMTEGAHDEATQLAANQGLYNGFLAAALFYGLWLGDDGARLAVFGLLCVFAAGIFGACTVDWKLLVAQTLFATLALAAIWLKW